MPSMESLVEMVGQPVDSPAVQALVVSERLESSTEPDFEEGERVRSHLSSPGGGFEFTHSRGRIETLFIYVRPAGGNAAFRGALMHGLSALSTRADVRRCLGTPSRSGDARAVAPLGRFGAHDRYDAKCQCLHFQYTEPAEEIELITVMMADIAPSHTLPYEPAPRPASAKSRLVEHPLAHVSACGMVAVSAGLAAHALWLWKCGERYLSPSDPGIGLIVAVLQSWLASGVTAVLAAVIGLANRKGLVSPVLWLTFVPAVALGIDLLAGRAIGYR